MPRPDQSFYLAHFTKDGKNYDPNADVNATTIDQMSALDRLIALLNNKKISAFPLPWTKKPAVCFTECPWGSLIRHAENYSCYGIGFTKKFVYSRKGNPVIYANPEMFHNQKWDEKIFPFITPFVPIYASQAVKNKHPFNGNPVDFSHEREWRVAKDFTFQYSNIAFVILKSVRDLEHIPESIISEIGLQKFLFMDTYRKIEELWPTHIMD